MTPAQISLYWRRWNAVVHANDWRWTNGRLAAEATRSEFSEHHAAVWRAAEARALQGHRAITADDLRHGCHIYALRRDLSMKDLANSAFSRLLCLWGDGKRMGGLLIEPDCNESRLHWDEPGISAAEGVAASLKQLPDATVRHVAADRFGTRMWEWLESDQQLQLLMTLKNWKRRRERPIHAPANSNEPF